MKKQFLAKLLVLAMVLTMVPVTILAASAATNTASNNDYSYSVAADTMPEELPESGVIEALPQGGVSNAVIKDEIVEALAIDDDGNIVLKLVTTDAKKVSVSLPVSALVAKSDDNNGLSFECSQVKVTVPGDQLAKAMGVKDGKASSKTLSIVVEPSANADELPTVTFYVDWKVVNIKGVTFEKV